jgi:hypothetical protein
MPDADRERLLNPRRRAVDGPNGTRISAKSRAAKRSRFGHKPAETAQ